MSKNSFKKNLRNNKKNSLRNNKKLKGGAAEKKTLLAPIRYSNLDGYKNLSVFLNKFINLFKSNDAETTADTETIIDMNSSELVVQAVEEKLSLDSFTKRVEEREYTDKNTGLFINDFFIEEYTRIQDIVLNNNGLCASNITPQSNNDDKEENEAYAVFLNPKDCYTCFLQIIPDNHNFIN